MKVNFDKVNRQNQSFEGYKPVKDVHGNKGYEFNFPFDSDNYDCYLEICRVHKDDFGNYSIKEGLPNFNTGTMSFPLNPDGNVIDMDYHYGLDRNEPFAYHYRLQSKHDKKDEFYRVDAGDVIDFRHKGAHEIYNLVIPTGAEPTRGGSMKLIIPDSYNVGFVYDAKGGVIQDRDILDAAMKSVRTYSNKLGGSLAGIEKDIDDGKFDGYTRIISTPIFTDDSLTHHGYWNKNAMQMVQDAGSINDYSRLQRKMFAKGLNWVADGAFVNEGLEGVHFQHVLKWGQDSPYYKWFRASGLESNALRLGILPEKTDYVRFKVINPPHLYKQNAEGKITEDDGNYKYDETKPTYFQIYDSRLVNDENAKDPNKLIKKYDKLNTDNLLEINNHQDTVIPYHFEVDPKEIERNIKAINEFNASVSEKEIIKLDSFDAVKRMGEFKNFYLDRKIEGGYDPWDANPDIPKLNYTTSHYNTNDIFNKDIDERDDEYDELAQKNFEVQDYAITSGKFWTKKTNQILNFHVAQNLKNINSPEKAYELIKKNIEKNIFPEHLSENISQTVVDNVFDDDYNLKGTKNKNEYTEQIVEGLMDVPLDSIELGDNITSVFASPLMSKRAANEDNIGVSRYNVSMSDIPLEYAKTYSATNDLYNEEMLTFAKSVLDEINKKLPDDSKLYDGTNTTDYGKYVIPLLTSEIAKFAVIKSLVPTAEVKVNKNNEVVYDYNKLKETSLQSIGVYKPTDPEDEVYQLLDIMKDGLNAFKNKSDKNYKQLHSDKEKLTDALLNSIKGTNYYSFALAEMIVDRSEAGLDWRIDAAKDIADINSLRSKKTDFETSWKQIINFWKKFDNNVLEVNPNAYIVGEVTDEYDLHNMGGGFFSEEFPNLKDVIQKFYRGTGMTATANYTYFFTDIPKLFGKKHEDGSDTTNGDNYIDKFIFKKMIGEDNYIQSGPLKSLMYSYTFADNHDKPRILHSLAMDMEMFYLTDLNHANDYYKEIAYRVVNDEYFGKVPYNSFDFTNISPKDVAMGKALADGFQETLTEFENNKTFSPDKKEEAYTAINRAIKDLSLSKFKDMPDGFDAEGFGVKPFDVTIDLVLQQAEAKHGLKLSKKEREDLKEAVFEHIMDPAMSKLTAIMKFFVALPGMPTIFAGDELASTGYESKTKNIHLQNRSYLHHEWVDEKSPFYKKFVAEYKDEIEKTMALRSRPELHALNDGAIFTLPIQKTQNGIPVSAILRQSPDGAMAISVFNTVGIDNHDPKHKYTPQKIYLDSINLNSKETENSEKIGLRAGLRKGMKFYNAANPSEVYIVKEDKTAYFLKKEGKDEPAIEVPDSTLILYHLPDTRRTAPPTFTGSKVMYNPQYNFVSQPYAQKQNIEAGTKLSLLAR